MNPFLPLHFVRKPKIIYPFIKRELEFSSLNSHKVYDDSFNLENDFAHPLQDPFYFEWWYFDVLLDPESGLVIRFSLKDILNPYKKGGTIDIAYFNKGNEQFHYFKRFRIEETIINDDINIVIFGKNKIIKDKNHYTIILSEDNVNGELIFKTRKNLVWQPGSGRISIKNSNYFFSWLVAQPRAEVQGVISIKNKRINIDGIGYHDHNWGNISLISLLDSWSWGRIYTKDLTFIYADLNFKAHFLQTRVIPFVLIKNGNIICSSNIDLNIPISKSYNVEKIISSEDYPKGWILKWKGLNNGEIEVRLSNKHLLEYVAFLNDRGFIKRKFIEKLIAVPRYFRFSALAEIKYIDGENILIQKGNGIYEHYFFY